MAEEIGNNIEFKVDRKNLYKEETFTDLKVCSIRRLTPVSDDGTSDTSRKTIFVGQTSLMSPNGPLPIQAIIQAKELAQAFKRFPEAMIEAMERLMEEAKKMKQEEDSRIIVPGR
jgi:hypothetical protein